MRARLVTPLLLLLAACGSSSTLRTTTTTTSGTEHTYTLENGIEVWIDRDVRFESRTVSGTGRPTENEMKLNGLPYSLEDGILTLGDLRIELQDGDKVEIRSSGITVNGRFRDPLPPSAIAEETDARDVY